MRTILVGRVAGEWRAYANECRHRALPLDLGASSPMSDDGQYLLCHQHGALYRLSDGRCVLGPCAGEALTPVAIELVVEEDEDNAPPRPAGSR
jgi:nitrite reductase/ring-hydroxylating ferredoxin subunit